MCAYTRVYGPRACRNLPGHKRASNLLEQELHVTVSWHVGTGWNRAQDPYKSSLCSQALSPLWPQTLPFRSRFPTTENTSGCADSLESLSPQLFLGAVCFNSRMPASSPLLGEGAAASGNNQGQCLRPEHRFQICGRRERGKDGGWDPTHPWGGLSWKLSLRSPTKARPSSVYLRCVATTNELPVHRIRQLLGLQELFNTDSERNKTVSNRSHHIIDVISQQMSRCAVRIKTWLFPGQTSSAHWIHKPSFPHPTVSRQLLSSGSCSRLTDGTRFAKQDPKASRQSQQQRLPPNPKCK